MSLKKVVVLLSGGIDSTTVLYEAHQSSTVVAALSFFYGAKHNACEIPFAQWHAQHLSVPHVVISLNFMNEHFTSNLLQAGGAIPVGSYDNQTMQKTVVPFRNGVMLSIAAGFAESHQADAIVIAAHAGDHAIYPDCRPDFMEAMASAIQQGTYAQIELQRPFIGMNKTAIIQRGAQLKVDFSHTWSCYVGGETHCGHCGTCLERREGFKQAKIPDPTKYLH